MKNGLRAKLEQPDANDDSGHANARLPALYIFHFMFAFFAFTRHETRRNSKNAK